MSKKILIRNPIIVTMNPQLEIRRGDILIEGKYIKSLDRNIPVKADECLEAGDCIVTPGFIQTHVHLCQTLFRNFADDLSLLDWLTKKIWPLEARHTAETMRLSARLGIAELIRSGTTTILDMGSVRHQDVIFEELAASGIRAIAGKTMMDFGKLPAELHESTKVSIDESLRLLTKWHNYDQGRLQYAFAPRFALSCSDELLQESGQLSREHGVIFHTHASENRDEVRLIHERFSCSNIQLIEKLNISADRICLAHCVWPENGDMEFLAARQINVLHCPSANLKLGSGFAPIPKYLEQGINVSLGADGAPCNNNLDIFNEMRLAALIQKPLHGPKCIPAVDIFRMATINGAKALGLEGQTGSIEVNKFADLAFIKNHQVHSIPYENIYSKLIYSTQASDVCHVMINGQWTLKNGRLTTLNEEEIIQSVKKTTNFAIN